MLQVGSSTKTVCPLHNFMTHSDFQAVGEVLFCSVLQTNIFLWNGNASSSTKLIFFLLIKFLNKTSQKVTPVTSERSADLIPPVFLCIVVVHHQWFPLQVTAFSLPCYPVCKILREFISSVNLPAFFFFFFNNIALFLITNIRKGGGLNSTHNSPRSFPWSPRKCVVNMSCK